MVGNMRPCIRVLSGVILLTVMHYLKDICMCYIYLYDIHSTNFIIRLIPRKVTSLFLPILITPEKDPLYLILYKTFIVVVIIIIMIIIIT